MKARVDKRPGKGRDLRLIRQFIPYIAKNGRMILFSIGLMLVLSLLDLAVPYITKMAVDLYIVPEQGSSAVVGIRLKGVVMAGVVLVLIALARFAGSFFQILVMELSGQRTMHDLRIEVYRHIQKLPMSFFTENTVGRLSTRVTNDIQNMQEMFTTIITFVMSDMFTLVGVLVILVYMDFRLAVAVMVILPVVVWTTMVFSGRSREVFRLMRAKISGINAMFSESCGGIRVIQLFTGEERSQKMFKNLNHENYMAGMAQIKLYGLFMPVVDLFGSLTLAIVIFYGGGRVVSDGMSLGTLVAFISYTRMFFRPVRDIAEKHNILQNALASGERIVHILDRAEEEQTGSLELDGIHTVEFKDVSFAYEPDQPVLESVSFSVKSGESLAILGPTGSGKTSLTHLLVKLYPRTQGEILINDRKIDTYLTSSLRGKIALISQDPYLFSGTIRENIIPIGRSVEPGEFEEILELSHLDSVVANLPNGADTRVGQGGTLLSSGERQLVSIARAFALWPDLIIFDEAASHVDTDSEEKIRLATARLKENRISITIAHRLRSAVTADKIIVLRQGRITEMGDHESLMKNRGFYHRLHSMEQMG
ncbi:ABC-type multidrug transport system, ATP-binding protein [Desulforapulum autotrophicum HRM2]|uniref:ABC-type multidrug transport system, ATP-binding protein n=1 Tax=Desulforapulum autotrophicum (strain ATCC 43914 / DSM 3382 / VKM B-1955 / HRM2) TaxID=177437 RepID=C0QM95_DESAH|nr:ABC transporter ATP-binding protein [Desulforapulum autotrophicum]ACN16412.1 ABC-type multidrug transport system, ATP-binding protein [Desulforapulum autotrophicum HRM2]